MAKVGEKLRDLRKRRQLSVREIADRSGISHSTVSLIERDKISPTVATLQAILDALGSSMAAFFAWSGKEVEAPFYRREDLPEIGNPETISYKIVGLNYPFRSIQLLKETYQLGADSGEMLSHAAQETGFVTSGEIEVTVGELSCTLRAGDAYYFDSRTAHRFRNVGDCVAEIVSAVSPPTY